MKTRRAPAMLGGGMLVLIGALVVVAALPGRPRAAPPPNARAVTAYQQRILPVVKDWGSIEVLGMRPAVADLQSGGPLGAPAVITAEARAWRASLEQDRHKLLALTAPPGLEAMPPLLDESMRCYLSAVDDFEAASSARGHARDDLLAAGIASAARGARLYTRASEVLHTARRKAGLPATTAFPHVSPDPDSTY